MPFTPSHAVLALPFVRTPLVPAAIAIGAMTPDLPLFVRFLPLRYSATHDLRWLAVTVLIALALLVVWRVVLRPAAVELLPGGVAGRLPRNWSDGARAALRETFPADAGRLVLLAASLLIGVLSHLLWDAFTHEGRLGETLLPVLGRTFGPFEGYRWLQHGSSVVGLLIIGVWALLWLRRRTPAPVSRVLPNAVRVTWWCSLPFVLVIAWCWGYIALGPFDHSFGPAHLAYRVLPPSCAIWALATLVLCIVAGALQRRRRAAPV